MLTFYKQLCLLVCLRFNIGFYGFHIILKSRNPFWDNPAQSKRIVIPESLDDIYIPGRLKLRQLSTDVPRSCIVFFLNRIKVCLSIVDQERDNRQTQL